MHVVPLDLCAQQLQHVLVACECCSRHPALAVLVGWADTERTLGMRPEARPRHGWQLQQTCFHALQYTICIDQDIPQPGHQLRLYEGSCTGQTPVEFHFIAGNHKPEHHT